MLMLPAMSSLAIAPPDTVAKDSLVGDKLYYLELKGTIRHLKGENKEEAQVLDSAIIKVFNEKGVLVAHYVTNRKGRCNFKLPLNRRFIVEVSKKGFVPKMIEVNTKVPPEKKLAYIFPFSLDIFEVVPGVDVSVLKKPIARINYFFAISQFDYDNGYTNKINSDLKKMYKEYYKFQKAAVDSTLDTNTKVRGSNPSPSNKKKKTI
jgi:hypothetical protein